MKKLPRAFDFGFSFYSFLLNSKGKNAWILKPTDYNRGRGI